MELEEDKKSVKNKIKEVNVDNENVYLKKGWLGWTVVNPIKNNDGSINWKNLIAGGSWIKLGLVLFFVFILVNAIIEVHNITVALNECLKLNPVSLLLK